MALMDWTFPPPLFQPRGFAGLNYTTTLHLNTQAPDKGVALQFIAIPALATCDSKSASLSLTVLLEVIVHV